MSPPAVEVDVREECEYGCCAWNEDGVVLRYHEHPVPGRRYRFWTAVAEACEGTFRRAELTEGVPRLWRITFDDAPPFETNLPLEFSDA